MKFLNENVKGIVLCIFELMVGILLMINPLGFTTGIIKIAGGVMLIFGVIEIVKYFRENIKEAVIGQTLTKGILLSIGGLFCLLKTDWFIVTFPVLTILYGVAILVNGVVKIQNTMDMLRCKNEKWFIAAINALLSIVCAVVILKSPFTSTAVMWIFTGVSLIVEGVIDIVTMLMRKISSEADEA